MNARILIIGSSSGIGYAVTEASLEFGASVIVSSFQESRIKSSLDQLQATYPSAANRISGYPCELSSPSVESNIAKLFSQSGPKPLDHVVFTAGDKPATLKIQDAAHETIQQAGMVRFNAPLLVAKHATQHLNRGPHSSITLTAGTVSEKPHKDWTVVASYATGLHRMMRNLAFVLASVRINLISPGAVKTPLWDGMPEVQRKGFIQIVMEKCTTGEIGKPEDVAEAFSYVMRDKNCSGSVIDSCPVYDI